MDSVGVASHVDLRFVHPSRRVPPGALVGGEEFLNITR